MQSTPLETVISGWTEVARSLSCRVVAKKSPIESYGSEANYFETLVVQLASDSE